MVVQPKRILPVTDRLRDTVRTFQQVKSQLDSTLETVTNGDQHCMMAIQDGNQYPAL